MIFGNYGGMFGLVPQAMRPDGKESLKGMRQLQEVAAAYGRSGGPGVSHSVLGQFTVPTDPLIIFGKIRNEDSEGSGSGSGSGSFTVDPAGAGFTDNDGYLAYAFDQVSPFQPWKGELVEGGIATVLPSANGEGGGNFAYPLNGEIFDENVIVMLVRAGDHWVIVGGSGTAGSGGGPGFTFDCETGDFVVL